MRNAMWVGGGITGMGEIPMLGTGAKGLPYLIKEIFRNGEQGFFYDPKDLTPLKQNWRTNMLTWTEDFAKWANGFTATPVTDGWLLEATDSINPILSLQYPIGSNVAAGTIVRSIELKKGTADFVRVGSASDSGAITIDLRTLTVVRNAGSHPYTLQELGDGWFRFEFFHYSTTFGASLVSNALVWGMTHSSSTIGDRIGSTLYARKPSYAYIPGISSNTSIPYQAITDFNSDFIKRFPDHTVFQNTVGTIPVTAREQPIGLIRDKSGLNNHAQQTTSAARPLIQNETILGPNLVTNGDFSNGGDGWMTYGTPAFTFNNGRAYYNGTGGSGTGVLHNDAGMEVGKTYKISYDYEVIQYAFMAGGTQSATIGGRAITGKGRRYFNLTVLDARDKGVMFRPENTSSICEFYIDNVTVQEVIGYNTAVSKVGYDGVDDKLITNLPAPLTNATVLRAIPNVGTQVKYNQTLPMLYEDSTNHSGLIAIDRALTRFEQLRLMEELDKKVGTTGFDTTTFKMFDGTQEGFLYDPNDLTTLFQDAAGTVPVTAVGQPVGLILDKSKGLVRGENLAETLDDVAILDGGISTGTWDAQTRTMGNTSSTVHPTRPRFVFNFATLVDAFYEVRIKFTGDLTTLNSVSGIPRFQPDGSAYAVIKPTSNLLDIGVITALTPTTSLSIAEFSVRQILGNHAYQTTSASRPILRKNDVTGANYLEFDGSDDFLQTNNIDFTATDKVSLFAGVRKMSDAAAGVVVALGSSDNDNGTFTLHQITRGRFQFASKGSASAGAILTIADAPSSTVIDGFGNISADIAELRVNAVSKNQVTTDQGTGNYGNYPLYIGRRGGTTLPFNGHIYGLIGIGKLVPDTVTAVIEKELAKRTGVTLNV